MPHQRPHATEGCGPKSCGPSLLACRFEKHRLGLCGAFASLVRLSPQQTVERRREAAGTQLACFPKRAERRQRRANRSAQQANVTVKRWALARCLLEEALRGRRAVRSRLQGSCRLVLEARNYSRVLNQTTGLPFLARAKKEAGKRCLPVACFGG